jgi:aldehyde:ferredoxin oxidoreductase
MSAYAGKFLRVDLGTGRCTTEDVPDQVKTFWVGGRGFGAKYLYDELAPGIDPLGPENKVFFITGPLAGTSAQGCARWMIITKSPLTGTFTRSVGGGDLGAWIKFAGLDFIVIEGKAPKPVYIFIENDRAEVRDASALWGLGTGETQARLEETHGKRVRAACIGPGGENLVRFASVHSGIGSASRGGVGTVMGAKNLKALAIVGTSGVTPHDPKALKAAVAEQLEWVKANPMSSVSFEVMHNMGTMAGIEYGNALGTFPTRNSRWGQMEGFEKIAGGEYQKLLTRKYGCYACGLNCYCGYEVKSGPYKCVAVGGPNYESVWAFTGTIDSPGLEHTIYADTRCDDMGVDTISMGVTIGCAFELFERGLITTKDTDGLKLVWGNHDAALQLIEKTARREGFGDLLAEGSMRMTQRLGRGAEAYAMHVKGQEMPAYEPRGLKAQGMNFATANVGANHNYGYAPQEIYGVQVPRPTDPYADDGNADITKYNQDLTAMIETGIQCTFYIVCDWITPEIFSKLLVAATGIPEHGDPQYMWKVAERIYNMERAFNIREGFGRKDDSLPQRFLTEELQKGPAEGQRVRKQDAFLDQYYDLRGWDRSGIPTKTKLQELGLGDLVRDIVK